MDDTQKEVAKKLAKKVSKKKHQPKITEICIENFRGLKRFELKDVGKINIFLGRNGIGKTSLLEALWLMTGGHDAELMKQLDEHRYIFYKKADDFLFPFYQQKPENMPTFVFKLGGKTRELKIMPQFVAPKKEITLSDKGESKKGFPLSNAANTIKGYEIVPNFEPDNHHCLFLDKDHQTYRKIIGNLIQLGHKGDIIAIANKILPAVKNLEFIGDTLYLDIGMGKLLPLNLAGDGLGKVINIFSCFYYQQGNFVALDEIENGLHYRSQKVAWETLAHTSATYNVDSFISTHSYEMLESLDELLREKEEYRELFKIHTLFKNKSKGEGILVSSHDFEEFSGMIKNKFELRGLF